MAAASVHAQLDIDTADLFPAVLAKRRGEFIDIDIALERIF
jgi:hypothetical protein